MPSLAKQAFTVVFARGSTRAAQFVAFIILGRFLTPEEFGWYGLVTTAIAMAVLIGSLGLRQSIAFRIGREEVTPGEGLSFALLTWPALTLLSSVPVYLLYHRESDILPSPQLYFVILAAVAGSMLIMLLQGVFLGRGEIKSFSATETLPRVALAALAALLALIGYVNIATAMWAYALGFLIAIPVALWLVLKKIELSVPRLSDLPRMVGYGMAFAANLFAIMLCSRISLFAVEHYYGSASAGQFFAALRLNEIFLEAAAAFGFVVFSDSTRDSRVEVPFRNAKLACLLFWMFNLVSIVMFFAAPVVVWALVGSDYTEAASILQVLCLSLGPAAGTKVIYPTIAGQGRPLFGTPAIILSLSINVLVAWMLIPFAGTVGGAVALVLGQYVLYFAYAISCRRIFGVPVLSFFMPGRSEIRKAITGLRKKIGTRLIGR